MARFNTSNARAQAGADSQAKGFDRLVAHSASDKAKMATATAEHHDQNGENSKAMAAHKDAAKAHEAASHAQTKVAQQSSGKEQERAKSAAADHASLAADHKEAASAYAGDRNRDDHGRFA